MPRPRFSPRFSPKQFALDWTAHERHARADEEAARRQAEEAAQAEANRRATAVLAADAELWERLRLDRVRREAEEREAARAAGAQWARYERVAARGRW